MPDPFEALRTPVTPVDPNPTFANRLRARIERALDLPEGVTVSNLALEELQDDHVAAAPAVGAAIPYLAVSDGRRALEWYVDVLGARLRGEPIVMPDDRVGHAELEIGDGVLYLADEFPEIGHVAPTSGAGVSLVLSVPDVDATVEDATAAGATLTRPVYEDHGSRNGTIIDPFGHRWMLHTPLGAPQPAPVALREGDIAYASLWVPDAERASSFFASVLGWTYEPDSAPGRARQVQGTTISHGIYGGQEHTTLFLCYVVDDVAEALERVRTAGGDAEQPTTEPYGVVASCVDDQGTPFAVVELPADEQSPAGDRPVNGVRNGDLAYVTLEVVDTGRARAFYGSVLGWEYTPGHIEDGWNIEGPMPMMGMWGHGAAATGVPMYRVDDIESAVDRVRAAGGTATDPEQQPYGISADCVDDQGTRFGLGQL